MNKIYSEQEIKFIRKYYPEKGAAWVAGKLGKQQRQIKSFAKNNKLARTHYYMSEAAAIIIKTNVGLSFKELSKLTGVPIGKTKFFEIMIHAGGPGKSANTVSQRRSESHNTGRPLSGHQLDEIENTLFLIIIFKSIPA